MGNKCSSTAPIEKTIELNDHVKELKIKSIIFYDDLNIQKNYCENYRAYVSELNYQLNNLKDQLNISISTEKNTQNILTNEENIDLINDLGAIMNRINEYNELIENQKTELKHLESNFNIIQKELNDSNINDKSLIKVKIESIEKQLSENEKIVKN